MQSINYFQNEENNFFENKNIIITGATGGIGTILVKILVKLKANLLLISHDEKKLKNKFNDILNFIQYEILDLENPKKITFQFQNIMIKLKGRLNILIMCHGKYNISLIKDCDISTFDNLLNLNVRSTIHFLSLCVPFLKLTKGNVIILSSLESRYQIKYGFLNSMTKSMINSLIECSALELAPFGIRINGIAPGITNTNHRVGNSLTKEENEEYLKAISNNFLLKKSILQPEDIVNNILFLASDDAGFITGEIMENDNGYSLNNNLSYND
jgi:3-oxoacyl-[acyl-carrier protein] reductase